ncbi:hypothetical protein AK812_SmicGene9342 [Symbiodinium microadriaticum]|uniref:Uncharacterized protein n=1 Tax=Symbiodinium microadriaticum TaxID=2951 RepID=A0A1Q9EIP0_SYMMI|nr:hypothetical protein AK812_SmicGene9342 [Symbiodinium microadriaticum]
MTSRTTIIVVIAALLILMALVFINMAVITMTFRTSTITVGVIVTLLVLMAFVVIVNMTISASSITDYSASDDDDTVRVDSYCNQYVDDDEVAETMHDNRMEAMVVVLSMSEDVGFTSGAAGRRLELPGPQHLKTPSHGQKQAQAPGRIRQLLATFHTLHGSLGLTQQGMAITLPQSTEGSEGKYSPLFDVTYNVVALRSTKFYYRSGPK